MEISFPFLISFAHQVLAMTDINDIVRDYPTSNSDLFPTSKSSFLLNKSHFLMREGRAGGGGWVRGLSWFQRPILKKTLLIGTFCCTSVSMCVEFKNDIRF